MPESKADRLARMKERQAQLTARIDALEEQEAKKRRAEDTRRKVLVGAVVLAEMESSPGLRELVVLALETRLTHNRDRVLFPDLLGPAEGGQAGQARGAERSSEAA